MFYGAILFKLFGVLTRWLYFKIYYIIINKKSPSFRTLWNNDVPGKNDSIGQFSGEFADILIGAGVIYLICLMLVRL
jgi:hypothetical protein